MLCGPSGRGKSRSIYASQGALTSNHEYKTTLGMDVLPLLLNYGGEYVCANLWDIGGTLIQESVPAWFKEANKAIIVAYEEDDITFWVDICNDKNVSYVVVRVATNIEFDIKETLKNIFYV
jgi:hypothetical protein